MKTLNERKAILEDEIRRQFKNGWRVESKTVTVCTLIKEKEPEISLVIILLLFLIIPGIIYLAISGKKTTAFIEVNDLGKIIYTSRDLSPYELQESNKQANIRFKHYAGTTPGYPLKNPHNIPERQVVITRID